MKGLQAKMNKEVLDRFTGRRTTSHGSRDDSQTSRTQQREQPRGVGEQDPLRVSPRRPPDFRDEWTPPTGTFPYGDGDRFPGHPGGGGMLMDPFRTGGGLPSMPGTGSVPGQLPRGSVPPGARFDPFGPVPPGGARGDTQSGRFAGPDPDELPPPGYDDMFM
ncbi:Proteasome inhibitor PI31 subunit [Exaiptasia diaphana]|nr:Proteasome inhibitor PI31 subunit [Exaiptasia diaphana]